MAKVEISINYSGVERQQVEKIAAFVAECFLMNGMNVVEHKAEHDNEAIGSTVQDLISTQLPIQVKVSPVDDKYL